MEGAVLIELSQLLVGDLIVEENLVWEVTTIEALSHNTGDQSPYRSQFSQFARRVDLKRNGEQASVIWDPTPPSSGLTRDFPPKPPLRIRLFRSTTQTP